MPMYKQTPNIKMYNKNGDKIDAFNGSEDGSGSPQNDYVRSSDLANVAFTGKLESLDSKNLN